MQYYVFAKRSLMATQTGFHLEKKPCINMNIEKSFSPYHLIAVIYASKRTGRQPHRRHGSGFDSDIVDVVKIQNEAAADAGGLLVCWQGDVKGPRKLLTPRCLDGRGAYRYPAGLDMSTTVD